MMNMLRWTFMIWAAFAILVLPLAAQVGQVQIIHNSPYEEATAVDIYLDGELHLDDFSFRDATPYTEIPAGDHAVDVKTSDGAATLYSRTLTIARDTAYLVVAAGDPLRRAEQPEFQLFTYAPARIVGGSPAFVDFISFEGSPDIPPNETHIRGFGPVVGTTEFGQWSDGYQSMPAGLVYELDVYSGDQLILSYVTDATEMGGLAVFGCSSGFLFPEEGQPGIELMDVMPDGSVHLMPRNEALAQAVHLSSYAAIDTIDVYLMGTHSINDLAYGQATPLTPVPSGVQIETAPALQFDVVGHLAGGPENPVYSSAEQFIFGKTYAGFFVGDPESPWAARPIEGYWYEVLAEDPEPQEGMAKVAFFHGVGDAPPVQFRLAGSGEPLVSGLAYGELSEYVSIPTGATLEVWSDDMSFMMERISPNLVEGQVGIIASSGYAMSQPRPTSKGYLVLPDHQGGELPLVALPVEPASSTDWPTGFSVRGNYPNPFNPSTTFLLDLPEPADVAVRIFDVTGRLVAQIFRERMQAGAGVPLTMRTPDIPSGVYVYHVDAKGPSDTYRAEGRFVLVR